MGSIVTCFKSLHSYHSKNTWQWKLALPVLLLIAYLASIQTARAEWVEWVSDVGFAVHDNDNINQSAFSSDELSDNFYMPSMSIGRYYQLNDLTRLRLTLDFDTRVHDTFKGLDSTSMGVNAVVQHKFAVGPNAPWVRLNVSAAYLDVDEDVRDSKVYDFAIHTGRRFTPRLDASVGYNYHERNGRDNGTAGAPPIGTDVFDQSNHTVSANLNYLLTNRLLLSAGYSYLTGDFDSACTVANVGTVLANEDVKAIILDNVFGGCVYRLDGDINIFALNLSYALNGHASINLGYTLRDGKADVLEYESSILQASFIYSY